MVIAPPTSGDVLLSKVQLTKAAALMTEPKAIAPPVVPVAELLRNCLPLMSRITGLNGFAAALGSEEPSGAAFRAAS